MNKLITLQGYKNQKNKNYKYNPDAPPEYYSDHELGFSFAALLPKLPAIKFPLPPISLPAFPPISLPPLPSIPLPPLPVFPPLPNFFPAPIPPVKITPPSVPSVPPIKVTPPVISVPPIKVTPPVVSIKPPVIDAKIPPANQWKVDPQDVKTAAQTVTTIGQGLQAVGTVVGVIPSLQPVGAAIVGVGATAQKVGTTVVAGVEKIEKAQKLIEATKTGSVAQGLQAAGSLASSVGAPPSVTQGIAQVSNVVNQAQNLNTVIQSGNIPAAVNVTQNLLNQTGVSPSISSKVDLISKPINQAQNLLNIGTSTADKLLNQVKPGSDLLNSLGVKTPPIPASTSDLLQQKLKPYTVDRKPGSLLDTLFPKKPEPIPTKKPGESNLKLPDYPFLKDPSRDPNSPYYLPESKPSDKIKPDKKPEKLPGTVDDKNKKSENNIGIVLLMAAGFFAFTRKKKK